VSPTPRPSYPETPEERVLRKAHDIREAFLEYGLVRSPDNVPFDALPFHRRQRWIDLAYQYVEIFG
jgi:hypothetical protein